MCYTGSLNICKTARNIKIDISDHSLIKVMSLVTFAIPKTRICTFDLAKENVEYFNLLDFNLTNKGTVVHWPITLE